MESVDLTNFQALYHLGNIKHLPMCAVSLSFVGKNESSPMCAVSLIFSTDLCSSVQRSREVRLYNFVILLLSYFWKDLFIMEEGGSVKP